MSQAPQAMPASQASERALLGAVLANPQSLDLARGLIRSADAFHFDRHREIWSSMLRISDASMEVDIQSIHADLVERGKVDFVGGFATLSGLEMSLPVFSLPAVESYCRSILDFWARRRLVELGIRSSEASRSGTALDPKAGDRQVEELLAEVAGELTEISTDRAPASVARAASDILIDFDPWEPDVAAIPTGIMELDTMLRGGFRPGELTVIGARPSKGKSALTLGMARAAATAGHPVRYHALEMTAKSTARRIVAQESRVPGAGCMQESTDADRRRAMDAAVRIGRGYGKLLHVDDSPGLTVGQIAAAAQIHGLRERVGLIVVDALQNLGYAGRHREKRHQLGEQCAELRNLAKQLRVPVVLTHHLSRAHETESRPPTMRDLRESGDIEAHADAILFIWRPWDHMTPGSQEYRDAENLPRIIVAKQRDGATGQVEVVWIPEAVLFTSLARTHGTELPF